jgi:hypothetical protein
MEHDVDVNDDRHVKSELCTVRLTARQVEAVDRVAKGELSRSQVVRMLVDDFVRKPEKAQKDFVMQQLFREPTG